MVEINRAVRKVHSPGVNYYYFIVFEFRLGSPKDTYIRSTVAIVYSIGQSYLSTTDGRSQSEV